MPTRKITRSPVKVTGTAPDGQEFESTLEEDFLVLLRFNRLIERVETQTIRVEWADASGKIRLYTPDVLVHYRKDLEESKDLPSKLCEVKPDFGDQKEKNYRRHPPRTEDEEENKLKWAAATRFAALRGWEFEVVRESAIRTPYLKNAKFLLRYLERDFQTHHETEMLECLEREGPMSIEALTRKFSVDFQSRATILPICYRLIAKQQIGTDLMQPLSLNTVLTSINAG
jgi:hypothetical protein